MWCDFGLAKALDEPSSGLTTPRHAGHGTTRYSSPEIVEETTPRTLPGDVWAWGCVFMEACYTFPTR